jgi:threonylcarbamoyladenosine tRNA methylthiotransferase MtaB
VPVAEVLAEVDRVAAAGFKEIALTGVHLGSYGRDLEPRSSLLTLLEALSLRGGRAEGPHVPGLGPTLFRVSSLEPMDCTSDVVSLVAGSDALAPHFHLPLQHASNRLLGAMRRPYTIEQYSALVNDIRRRLPHAAIGSDLIAGFPGESDEEFEELAAYLEHSPLTHLHVFPYSDRPGTPAAGFGGKVPGPVVRERGARIRAIGRRLSERFRQSQLGTIHRALTLEDGTLAVTGNYLKVKVPAGRRRNEWVTVLVTGAGDTMSGELL